MAVCLALKLDLYLEHKTQNHKHLVRAFMLLLNLALELGEERLVGMELQKLLLLVVLLALEIIHP